MLGEEDRKRVETLGGQITDLRCLARYAEAVPLATEMLDICRRGLGEDWYETANALRLITTLKRIANLPAEQRRELAEAESGEQQAQGLLAKGDAEGALRRVEHLLETQRRLLGEPHPEVAAGMAHRGMLLYYTSEFDLAKQQLQAALALQRDLLGPGHPQIQSTLSTLGTVYLNLEEFVASERCYREALPMAGKLLGETHTEAVNCLAGLALVSKQRGDYPTAERLIRQVLNIERARVTQSGPRLLSLMRSLGQLVHVQGDPPEAERIFREALALKDRLLNPNHPELAMTLKDLARIRWEQGDYLEAETLLREAQAMLLATAGDRHPGAPAILRQLGYVAELQGDYEGAELQYRKALSLERRLADTQRPAVATALVYLGSSLTAQGELDQAEQCYREALEIYRQVYGPRHREIATTTHRLAYLAERAGDRTAALALCRQGHQMYQDTLGQNHPFVAYTATALAHLLGESGDPAALSEAEKLYSQAIAILRKAQSSSLHAACTKYAGFLSERRRRYSEAVVLFQEAIDQIERLRTRTSGDELDRTRYFGQVGQRDAFGGMARALLALGQAQTGTPPAAGEHTSSKPGPVVAFNYIERARGRGLLDLLDRAGQDLYAVTLRQAELEEDDDLCLQLAAIRRREREAVAARIAAQRTMESRKIDTGLAREEKDRRQTELIAQLEQASDAERQASLELYRLARGRLNSAGLQPITARQVAESLERDELLLLYDVGDQDTLLFRVRSVDPALPEHEIVRVFTLRWPDGGPVDLHSLTDAVGSLFANMSREGVSSNPLTQDPPEQTVERLSAALIPLELRTELSESARVFVIPDGPLHLLPFETLAPASDPDHRWLDQGPAIVYGPSSTVVMTKRRHAGRVRSRQLLVALGDPVFPTTQSIDEIVPPVPESGAQRKPMVELGRYRSVFHAWRSIAITEH